jgi:hypothetical protein
MCPECIATVAQLVAGATSTGGLMTALVVKKLRAKSPAGIVESITPTRGGQHESAERGNKS